MITTRWIRAAVAAVVVPLLAVAAPAPASAKPDPDKLKAAGKRIVAKPPIRGVRPPGGTPTAPPATVELTQSCTPATIKVKATTTCSVTAENTGATTAVVDLGSVTMPPLLFAGATGATTTTPQITKAPRATLAPARAAGPSGIAPDPGNLFGYIPLADFGGNTVRPIGDEEITELDVPSFVFNGKAYTKVGVSSNGYLVAGGGAATDVAPSGTLPGPARPNNVIAPFWTDLDGTGATGILANVLTDGVGSWIVVEWQVNVKGTSSPRVFQAWIGTNGAQDVQYAYRFDTISAPGRPLTIGAENADGTVGVRLPAGTVPTVDLRVTSTGGRPGGAASWTVTLKGVSKGTGKVVSAAKLLGATTPITTATTVTVER